MLVAINPGHYHGADEGCPGSRITEAELTIKYADLVIKYLNAAGVNTVRVHANSLSQICAEANDSDADLFLSIHFNGFNKKAHGTETLYCKGSTNGQKFAKCIQDQLISTLGLTDRGLKTDGLYVTRNTNMTAVLTEVGFIDNPEEEKILINRMDDACRAIARGVTDAINVLYGGSVTEDRPSSSCPSKNTSATPPKKANMASKYFAYDEVTCHHCGEHGASQLLLDFLDDLREAVGGPVQVTSVYRCPTHNANVGGVRNSQHVLGTAADVLVPPGFTVDSLASLGIKLGADGIGRYYSMGFVHMDVRDGRRGSDIEWTG